jgi:4a-hydroxytetrahydrobiopterin dehydratase
MFMASPKLDESAVESALASVPEWGHAGESIQRTYKFKDFAAAMKFVGKVADAAEAAQHHPDMLIRWNLVTLTLTTHDSGGITALDFEMAKKCDAMAGIDKPVEKPAAKVKKK